MKDNIIEYEELYKSRCKFLKNNGVYVGELNSYSNFEDLFSEDVFKEIIRRKQNRKNKRYRVKEKYKEVLKLKLFMNNNDDHMKLVFGTITFNDKCIKLKEDTKTRNISKWLKKHFIYTILNKDYGKKTEREHYHFVALTQEQLEDKHKKSKKGYEIYELVKKDYNMGFEPGLCIIDNDKHDMEQTINYLLKLNNHSNKNTTRSRVRIIKQEVLKLYIKTKITNANLYKSDL